VVNAENAMAKRRLEGGEMEEFEEDIPSPLQLFFTQK
jgi:hypothetical protein